MDDILAINCENFDSFISTLYGSNLDVEKTGEGSEVNFLDLSMEISNGQC